MKSRKLTKMRWGAVVATVALLWAAAAAGAPSKDGYLTNPWGTVIRTGHGECWRMGYWTPNHVIEECDPVARPPEVSLAPPPSRPVVITLSAEALFDFDRTQLRPDGQALLDQEVVAKLARYQRVDRVLVTGHADRIGSDAYNMRLSARRAAAVASYLASRGVPADLISSEARGEREPIVSCSEVRGRKALIQCLQPNRRVVVEVDAVE